MTGSRNARDHTWTKGERDSTRRNRDRGHLPTRLDDPPPSLLRVYIADQVCWWCGAGPWSSLAGHTAHAHGIRAADLRRLAGFFKHTPVCSEALSDYRSALSVTHLPKRSKTPKKRVMSEAGKESGRKRLQAWRDRVGPKEVRRQLQKAAVVSHRRYAKPHPCTAPSCSKVLPTARRSVCSPKCRREVRQVTGRKSASALPPGHFKRMGILSLAGSIRANGRFAKRDNGRTQ